jgi:hypothetical protein
MFAAEKEQERSQGRHSGWAKTQHCMTVSTSMSAEMGFPACTAAEFKQMVEQCVKLGLLDSKYCDADDGLQRYVRTSSLFEDCKAYAKYISIEDPKDGSANRWWTKNSRGEYHPNGPSLEDRGRFRPIIERFLEGLRVERCFRMPCCIGQNGL